MILRPRIRFSPNAHLWPALLIGVVAVKATLSLAFKPTFILNSYGTSTYFLLLVLATGFALRNAVRGTASSRLFWIFIAGGYGLWALDQWIYVYYTILLRTDVPDGSVADPALFLHIVPLMAAVAIQPSVARSDQTVSRASLNFLVLLFFWVFLYAYLLFPYQYLFADDSIYNPRFTALYAGENTALVLALAFLTFRSEMPWRAIYFHLLGASTLYGASSTLANIAIDSGWRYNGTVYSLAQTASVCWCVWVPLRARQLASAAPMQVGQDRGRLGFTSLLAKGAILAIPLIGMVEFVRPQEPSGMRTFRLAVVLGTLFLLIMAVLLKEYWLKRDLILESRISKFETKLSEAALHASETLKGSILASLDDRVAVLTKDGTVIDVNDSWKRGDGPMREAASAGTNYLDFLRRPGNDSPEASELVHGIQRVLDGSVERWRFDYCDHRMFPPKWLAVTLTPLLTAEGGVVVVYKDITEIRSAEARYGELVESVPAIVWRADPVTFRFSFVSRQVEKILGYPAESWRDEPNFWFDHTHPEDRERVRRATAQAIRERGWQEAEYRMVGANGQIIWLHNVIKAVAENDRVFEVLGVAVDITERTRISAALEASENRFRVVYERSPVGICLTQAGTGRFLAVNPKYCEIAGRSEPELLSRDVTSILHPDDVGRGIEKMRSLASGECEHFETEQRYLRPDGSPRSVSVAVVRMPAIAEVTGWDLGIVQDVTEMRRLTLELEQAKEKLAEEKVYLEHQIDADYGYGELIGQSQGLKQVMQSVARVAASDATVLLLGETGTGKELIARAIHRSSKRRNASFIKMNCAAIPSGLLESELFGYEKGAFTSATTRKLGRFELADKGTLFLDEIGDIALELQPKLLRVLQDHEFERLGGTQTLKVNFRLIAATNKDLAESVRMAEFRSDLYYRLNVFPICIPPLRERRDDIPLLVKHFVERFAQRMKRPIMSIPKETMDALVDWDWPGNIRELENFTERAVILTNGSVLDAPLGELESLRRAEGRG